MLELLVSTLVLGAVAASFFVSASAGLGGSLILVPTLAATLGTKEGIAMAALLLAANNAVKVFAYRRTLPVRSAVVVVVPTVLGALIGARLLLAAPEMVVAIAVVAALLTALFVEERDIEIGSAAYAPTLALAAGATSGFAGTSGPLKGIAIRSLKLNRFNMVGAAALASLFGDASKTAVFTDAKLLDRSSYVLALSALPLMLAATFAGKRFNETIGERGYKRLFWVVMSGYAARLFILL